MLKALHEGVATCQGLSVQARKKDADDIFLFARGNRTLAQAKIPLETIRKLVDHPDQFRSSRMPRYEEDSQKMKDVANLITGSRKVALKATVVEKSEARAVTSRYGNQLLVCSATLSDRTGKIRLLLWNNQIALISKGDKILVENAKVTTFRGEKQLSLERKIGKITVINPPRSRSQQRTHVAVASR